MKIKLKAQGRPVDEGEKCAVCKKTFHYWDRPVVYGSGYAHPACAMKGLR